VPPSSVATVAKSIRPEVQDVASRQAEEDLLWLLYDPQTSGGLLIAAPGAHAREVDRALSAAGVAAVEVGRVETRSGATAIAIDPA